MQLNTILKTFSVPSPRRTFGFDSPVAPEYDLEAREGSGSHSERNAMAPRRTRWSPILVILVLAIAVAAVGVLVHSAGTPGTPADSPTATTTGQAAAPTLNRTTTQQEDETRAYAYAGLPRSAQPVKVLRNIGYIVGYSEARENPLWIAYRVFRVGNAVSDKRPDNFSVDGRTSARVRPDAYTRSGYDRGHMAPNYAINTRYGPRAQLQTFLMSNICPQKPNLNRYAWKELEMLVAKRYANELEEVWVICGPIFDQDIEKLASGVEVPDAFYKIIVDERSRKVRVLAFIMPQGVARNGEHHLEKFLTSVDEIERETGLDFLEKLPDDVEDKVEAEKAGRLW